jgi:hypothetical protein
MRILVLEDSIARVNYFVERYGNHDLTIIENAYKAMEFLEEEIYDVIFLDNDLGHDNGEGLDVARYLYEKSYNENNNSLIIIHSWNMSATKSIVSLLPYANVIPYGTYEFSKIRLDK